MKALIDGDIVCYRSAASAEKDDVEIALIRASRTLQDMVSVTGADEIALYLSGTANFRKEIYPEYKANRLKLAKPKHLNAVREFLILQWGAEVTDGYEADDALGIAMGDSDSGASRGQRVCCSIDKDLLQLPGLHYNFVLGEYREVDVVEGWRSFYKQLVLGDRGDNVPGYDGKMRVKFPKFLTEIRTGLDSARRVVDMYNVVRELYNNDETLIRNGRLLYVWRRENDQWQPPVSNSSEAKPETVEKSASTTMQQAATTPSTGRIGMKRKKSGSRVRGRKMGS